MWQLISLVIGALVVGTVIGSGLDAAGVSPAYDQDMTQRGLAFGVGLAMLAVGATRRSRG